jgi:hypothetical protein
MTFRGLMVEWFEDILENIDQKHRMVQRHKKVSKSHDGKSEKLRQRSDVTTTHAQATYENITPQGVLGVVLGGSKGSDVAKYCLGPPEADEDGMVRQRALVLFKGKGEFPGEGDYERLVGKLRDSFWSRKGYAGFIARLRGLEPQSLVLLDLRGATTARLVQHHLDYLWSILFPKSVRAGMGPGLTDEDRWEIIDLVRDTKLRQALRRAGVSDRDASRFLGRRVAQFGGDLPVELLVEMKQAYPLLRVDDQTSAEKCMLTLFFNMRKALRMTQVDPSLRPTDLRKVRLVGGLDRRRMSEEVRAMVRPERAKAYLRRAKHLYHSGLRLMARGVGQNEPGAVAHGFGNIYNIRSREFEEALRGSGLRGPGDALRNYCPLFNLQGEGGGQQEEYLCSEFREKQSAAAALLLAYMELMDCMVSPSPPLLARRDMCVTDLYVDPVTKAVEDFRDVENYKDRWSAHKQKTFREYYHSFLRRYMQVGFRQTGALNPHTKLPLLNLDDWGEGEVVVNPFRVREDTFVYKLLGALRFAPNRLGIGAAARGVWARHKIRRGFDRAYCDAYTKATGKRPAYFPRPVQDMNYTEGGEGRLYFGVASADAVAPAARRGARDKLPAAAWFRGDLLEGDLPEGDLPPRGKIVLHGAQQALLDVHRNFRLDKKEGWGSVLLGADVLPERYKYKPLSGKEGITEGAPSTEPPPPLFQRLYHPEKHALVDPKHLLKSGHGCKVVDEPFGDLYKECFRFPEWVEESLKVDTNGVDESYPYPLVSAKGDVSANVFPVGWSKTAAPPYELTASQAYVVVPNRAYGYWDLRNSLAKMAPGAVIPELNALLRKHKKLDATSLPQNDWGFRPAPEVSLQIPAIRQVEAEAVVMGEALEVESEEKDPVRKKFYGM